VHVVHAANTCYGRSAARTQHVTRQNGHLRNAQSTRRLRTHTARVDTRRMASLLIFALSRNFVRKEKPETYKDFSCILLKGKKNAFRNCFLASRPPFP